MKCKILTASIIVVLAGLVICCSQSDRQTEMGSGRTEDADAGKAMTEEIVQDSSKYANPADRIKVLDFGAEWCVWCHRLEPVLDEVKKEYGDRVIFEKIDTDVEPELAAEYNVQGLPTLVFIDSKGNEVTRIEGFTDAAAISAAIRSTM